MSCFLNVLILWIFSVPLNAVLPDEPNTPPALTEVRDYCYLLQPGDINVAVLRDNEFDLVVLEYSRFGDAESEFTAAEIDSIRSGGTDGQPKIVLAYLSIGEAEDYRFYWQTEWSSNQPSWLGPVNPDWPGNYKVRYWDKDWKNILFGTSSGPQKSYLDRIIDQGFDGVYLDIIDAYEYWSSQGGGKELSRRQARSEMYFLLKEMKDYARDFRGKSEFLLFPQNAADIIYDDHENPDQLGIDYLALCDGIGQEDIWFNESAPQPRAEFEWLVQVLALYREQGKPVLSVDYIWDSSLSGQAGNTARFNDFYSRAYARDYIPYAAHSGRALDEILFVLQGNGILYDQPRRDRITKKIRKRRAPDNSPD